MIQKKIVSVFTILFILISAFSLNPTINAVQEPRTTYGYVFIDNVIDKPEKVVISFQDKNIQANLYQDGYYLADFEEENGETGIFLVTIDGEDYTAEETITIEKNLWAYEIDIHVNTGQPSSNNVPLAPINPNPINNSKNINLNPLLSVFVEDPDGDSMDVTFRNASDNSIISVDTNVNNGTYASIIWNDLKYNTTYNWYASADDKKGGVNTSDIFTFKTKKKGINNPPFKPINPTPENNSKNMLLHPELNIYVEDPDKDSLRVEFYNASDNSIINTLYNIESSTIAKITWNDLSYKKTYYWYVKVNDSEYSNKSDVFNFETKKIIDTPPKINITFPKKGGLYLNNEIFFEGILKNPVIFGDITIKANATDEGKIDRVEFYIYSFKNPKGVLLKNDSEAPYTADWKIEKIRLMHLYVIRAKAYDDSDKTSFDEVIVRKFF